jgi:hypothetical protein
MKKSIILLMLTAISAMMVISSCSSMNDRNNPMNPSGNWFVQFSPTNNTDNVLINDKIILTFAKAVDPKIIEANFVLISQKDMNDALCPISNDMGHSDMGNAMKNMDMMKHLKDVHRTKGIFNWSADSTMCEFTPDSVMDYDMEYMMLADRDMVKHMEGMMKMMGDLTVELSDCPCHKNKQNNTMLLHFKTEPAAKNNDGHESHHN